MGWDYTAHRCLPGLPALAAAHINDGLSNLNGDASATTVLARGPARRLDATLGGILDPAWKAPIFLASELGGVVATASGVYDDAAHDQAPALQAAINAMPATGGILILPTGNILLKSTVTIPGARITLSGAFGQYGTQIVCSSTFLTGDVIVITGSYSGVDGLAFDVAATPAQITAGNTAFRTSGNTVNLQNGYGFVRNASIRGAFVGILLGTTGGCSTVRDVTIEYTADGTANPGSGGVDINNSGFGPDNVLHNVRMQPNFGATTVYRPSFGIRIQNSGATQLTSVDVTGMQTALLICPGYNQKVEATKSSGCYWDGSTGNSVVIQPTSNGFVMSTHFVNDWITSIVGNANGLTLIGAGATAQNGQAFPIMDTQFVGGKIVSIGAQTGTGIYIADAYSRDTTVAFASIGGFYWGVYAVPGASHITVAHNCIGVEGNYPGTSQPQPNVIGVGIASGPGDFIQIVDNQISAFKTAALSFQASGTHNLVRGNAGYNPVGIGQLTPGSSPWTVTVGPTETDLYFNGGTVSQITVNGLTLATASPCRVTLAPCQSAVVTYSAAPTVVQSVK